MNLEPRQINQFKPRDYQKGFLKALCLDGYKNLIAVYHRRAGKDYMCFNGLVPLMLARPIVVVYIFKTAASGRRILWDARDIDGNRTLSAIPNEAIAEFNNQTQQIILKNGSVFRIIGSDNYDETIIGNNIHYAVFSEYSTQPRGQSCYAYLHPDRDWE